MPDDRSRPDRDLEADGPPATEKPDEQPAESASAGLPARRLRWPGLRRLSWPGARRLSWSGLRRSFVWTAIAAIAVASGAVVSVTTVDLGPSLRAQAEGQFAAYLDRPVTIGRLSTRLAPGRFLIEDLEIGGLNRGDRPFFQAERLEISTEWLPLLQGEVLVDAVELRGWRMLVEGFADGRQTLSGARRPCG